MGVLTKNITALLPLLKKLQWKEKVMLIQMLSAELIEDTAEFTPNQPYPVWTPLNAYEASDVLTKLNQKSLPCASGLSMTEEQRSISQKETFKPSET